MKSALCFLALVAFVVAEEPEHDGYYSNHGPPRPYYGHGGHGGYRGGRHSGGYGYRGGPPSGYEYTHEDYESLDAMDKLYQRLETVQAEIKTGSQLLANLEARLSLSKRYVEQTSTVTLPDLMVENNNIVNLVEQLENDFDDLEVKVNDAVLNSGDLNADAKDANIVQYEIYEFLNQARTDDTFQGAEAAEVLSYIKNIKDNFLVDVSNFFNLVDYNTGLLALAGNMLEDTEDARICEVGQVTLDADDRKAEYLFQTSFETVPQILYSICGYNFDMEARPNVYDHYYKEPNAMGLLVTAEASKTGLTVEVYDQSFGDTALLSSDVCFQVCSIGPSSEVLPRMPMMPVDPTPPMTPIDPTAP